MGNEGSDVNPNRKSKHNSNDPNLSKEKGANDYETIELTDETKPNFSTMFNVGTLNVLDENLSHNPFEFLDKHVNSNLYQHLKYEFQYNNYLEPSKTKYVFQKIMLYILSDVLLGPQDNSFNNFQSHLHYTEKDYDFDQLRYRNRSQFLELFTETIDKKDSLCKYIMNLMNEESRKVNNKFTDISKEEMNSMSVLRFVTRFDKYNDKYMNDPSLRCAPKLYFGTFELASDFISNPKFNKWYLPDAYDPKLLTKESPELIYNLWDALKRKIVILVDNIFNSMQKPYDSIRESFLTYVRDSILFEKPNVDYRDLYFDIYDWLRYNVYKIRVLFFEEHYDTLEYSATAKQMLSSIKEQHNLLNSKEAKCQEVAKLFDQYHLDVMCINEVNNEVFNQLSTMSKLSGTFKIEPAFMPNDGNMYTIFLIKPILELTLIYEDTFDKNKEFKQRIKGYLFKLNRGKEKPLDIRVYGAHLKSGTSNEEKKLRYEQIKNIVNKQVKYTNELVVIMGDMNEEFWECKLDRYNYPVRYILEKRFGSSMLERLSMGLHGKYTTTKIRSALQSQISKMMKLDFASKDIILSNMEYKYYRVHSTEISDHKFLYAGFGLNKKTDISEEMIEDGMEY